MQTQNQLTALIKSWQKEITRLHRKAVKLMDEDYPVNAEFVRQRRQERRLCLRELRKALKKHDDRS